MKNSIHMACKKGQFDVVELMVTNQFKALSINLNARHVNGMTHFDLTRFRGKLVKKYWLKIHVRLLDILMYVD